ncbi:glycopeptide resistance protein VanZ-Pt [Paenibacillus apiarius]|uniref:Glycopeptide resistance protein VanZ-Pt n=1 Tax=Paenibacillus apiarius TaxID=46240 RepID=A0ABT4DTB3_9BACL|nr:glycopeptide resistance protein VanZ-Pt [Paenibacillus apiarius]MCY9520596.1 glycopeptide resistance protein VanZ-Pt [Paenibacillus apiarius]MCY9555447.1 glycopeptide resistance protein VanZ-Pt [Paenibacillus apiarius]MCY9561116.1 glycopeptide resistance protein VanZ-Pt [Paenibacillus apiarius]MCY9687086.1 glycopeptide resistance protein VanZ-Pt [Paenibacillus apiarius]MCY9725060.1 glycopeptide resistance protein VanZ-Pt [Paenibacillus apiarius]
MNGGSRLKNWVVRAFFASYMYALFKFIVLKFGSTDVEFLWVRLMRNSTNPECIAARLHADNLIHLKEISRASDSMSGHSLLNLIGNVGIFVPLGIFLGVLAKSGKLTLAGSFWSSLGVSLVLDYTQVLFSIGTFDVDDLILNSTGGSIGFVVYALCARLTTAASSVPNGKPA